MQASGVLSREYSVNDLRRTSLTDDIESAFTNFPSPAAPVMAKDFRDMKQDRFAGQAG